MSALEVAAQTILSPPTSLTVYEDDPASFSVTASGPPLLQYRWRKNNSPVGSLSTVSSYTIAKARLSDMGNYDVVVSSTSSGLSVTSAPATLTVLSGVSLSVAVTGSGAVFSTPSRISAPGPDPLLAAKFPPGSSVTLTATPAVGWSVGRWWLDGVQQPGAATSLTVIMDAVHAVGVEFSPGPGAARYSFIAISGPPTGGPIGGGVYFRGVSNPQIDDTGRVLFSGSLISTDPNYPLATYEVSGLWYSRAIIGGHLDNAIIREYYSWVWFTSPGSDFGMKPVNSDQWQIAFTADGDLALGASVAIDVAHSGTVALVYEPYAPYNPPPVTPPPPSPRFQTVASAGPPVAFSPPNPPPTTNVWSAVGRIAFQGNPPSAVPVSGWERLAFVGTYVTYVPGEPIPIATNTALASWTRNGGSLIAPVSLAAPGPIIRSVYTLLGNGRGDLAGDVSYATGNGAGQPAVWTGDGGILAVVGSAAPNLPAGFPVGTTVSFLGGIRFSKFGTLAFPAQLAGSGLSLNSNTVVYVRRPGQAPVVVARSGDLIAGAPAPANLSLSAAVDTVSVADDSSGDVAIGTHLSSAGGPNVIIRHNSSGNHLAFIDGTPLPAFGPNKKLFLQRIDGSPAFWYPPTINGQGRIAFFGIVAEKSFLGTDSYARGVWMLESDGTLKQLLVEGQILPEFGRVDVIREPRGNRWVNNNGDVVLGISQTIQITPTTLTKSAILKISTGPALLPVVSLGASPSSGAGALALRWSAYFPDAIIEASAMLGAGGTPWSPISPVVRRVGTDLEAEITPTGDMGFFRLLFPAPEAP